MALKTEEIESKLHDLSGWERIDVGGNPGIQKTFKTGTFMNGLTFLNRVAVIAEAANHHPDVIFTYPKVTLQLTTHDAGGLTQKDFDLASQVDALPH